MVFKGASLSLLAYGDAGVRPMDDVDVLVPIERAGRGDRGAAGSRLAPDKTDPPAWTEVHHSLGIAGPRGGNVDLHWFSLWQPARDEPLWRAAVPLELAGVATLAPCPADQLLLACVHGTPWSPLPPFRWIADAVTVIRSAGEGLDWDRLVSEAERRRLTVATAAALAYLREEFGARCRTASSPACGPRRPPATSGPPFAPPAAPTGRCAPCAWPGIATGACAISTRARPRPRLPRFARRFWGLESAWQLPLHAGRAFSRRRGRGAGRSAL